MKNSKLFMILKTFSPDEFNRFELFVNSKFFNNLSHVNKLFGIIKTHYPDFDSAELTSENVFRKLYPGESLIETKLRNLVSDLMNLAGKFLAYSNFEKDGFKAKLNLLRELNDRNLFNIFDIQAKRIETVLESMKYKDDEYYYNKYILEQTKKANLNRRKSVAVLLDDNEQKMTDHLIIFFLITILQKYVYMLNQKKLIYDYDFHLDFLNPVIEHLKENKYEGIPMIGVLYSMVMIYNDGNEKYFFALKSDKDKYYNLLDFQLIKGIYVILLNYCAERTAEGKIEYLKEDFELNRQAIERDIFIESSFIPHVFFKMAVLAAAKVNEFEWAEDFIRSYNSRLHKDHSYNTQMLCFAITEYFKKNFEISLEYLSKVQTEDISYKLDIKTYSARIYYELGYTEPLFSLIDNYSRFVSANPMMSARLKKIHLPFSACLSKLANLRERPDDFEIHKLGEEALKIPDMSFRSWMIEKLDELKAQSKLT